MKDSLIGCFHIHPDRGSMQGQGIIHDRGEGCVCPHPDEDEPATEVCALTRITGR